MAALDRLGTLVNQLARVDAESMRTALITAQVASMTHRFAEARSFLAQAEIRGAPPATVHRLSLNLDQACGTKLDSVLEARHRLAAESGRSEDLVPLGALLADLGEFDEADRVYRRALRSTGMFRRSLWRGFAFNLAFCGASLYPTRNRVGPWTGIRKPSNICRSYVKARVHLAEIYSSQGQTGEAEALLIQAVTSGDPEVCWRLADVMYASGKFADAEAQFQAARSGFDILLEKHLLAFADHAAEFYSGSGNDAGRALELASINVGNRPTLRAFEQAYTIAIRVGNRHAASELLAAARKRWGETAAFRLSILCRAEVANDDAGSCGARTEVKFGEIMSVLAPVAIHGVKAER